MNNPLLDKLFLKELDKNREKEVWGKIIALTIDEKPVEEITGKVMPGGSINVDGTSSVRRSCSLNLVAKEININDFYWGLNTKFKLLIGLTNNINPNYPDIIWFPQGTYIITNFSTSHGINNYSISIQGKDKMCLLNGEIGGSLTAVSTDFGKRQETDSEGNITLVDIPLKEIIMESVHEYAKEPWHNIIINDLDELGTELLEYKGEKPLYLYVSETGDHNEITQVTINEEQKVELLEDGRKVSIGNLEYYYNLNDFYIDSNKIATKIKFNDETYVIAKVEYGQTVGYRLMDLIYAGDLISSAGESLTSMLDKIVQMLGDFEYFYDLDGRFIFQRKKTYLTQSWNNIKDNDDVLDSQTTIDLNSTPYGYEFSNNNLTISFSNNPNLPSLKNDFSIWGTRKSVSGAEIPVHLRYAIDKKPNYYKAMNGKIYISDLSLYEEEKTKAKEKIITEVGKAIQDFEMKKGLGNTRLQEPRKRDDGSWTPGWWNIEDWYEFYYLLKQEYPNKTMKWYSQNTLEGAPLVSSIPGYEQKVDSYYKKPNYRCWLIIESKGTGKYNLQHGAGDPSSPKELERCFYSYIDENGTIQTVRDTSEPDKYFMMPYCGCNERHTYLEFIKTDISQGNNVYFYNPKFPAVDSFKEIVSERIESEFNELMESGKLQLCDWREIIYQMAKDYRRYNHYDSFLSKVKNNNQLYGKYLYPEGYTGYEQYYIDMEGFWRQLYNPNYKEDNFSVGGDGSVEAPIEVNSKGNFDEDINNIYVYPIVKLNNIEGDKYYYKKTEMINGKETNIYSPENTYFIYNMKINEEEKYFINSFLSFYDEPQKSETYYRYYNSKDFVKISWEEAKNTPIELLYVGQNKRYVDRLFEIFYQSFIIPENLRNIIKGKNNSSIVQLELAIIDFNNKIKIKDIPSDIKNYYCLIENNEVKTYKQYFENFNLRGSYYENPSYYITLKEIDYYHTIYNYNEPEYDDNNQLINKETAFWHKNINENPSILNFWIDFLDVYENSDNKLISKVDINKYSVPVVGNRPKVINDSKIKSIYFRETPKIIFVNKNKNEGWEKIERKSGYSYIQLPDSMLNLFNISAQGKDAQSVLEECLYNDTCCVESVSINTIPIYYLEPNTRIYIRDDDSKINGEYIVSRFTIPLSYNGTMSISATKIADRIL